MSYFSLEKDNAGLYVKRLNEEEFEINVCYNNEDDATITVDHKQLQDIIRGLQKVINS